jgi:hypothetical protein
MAMITAYFDASGQPEDTSVVSLSGLVSTAEKWLVFDQHWQECLDAFGVSAFHMRDFAHSLREFSSWRNDEPKRRRFLSGLINVIESHVDYVAASSVSMTDYRAVNDKYYLQEFMKPYTLNASTCAGSIIHWAREKEHSENDIAYVFEWGDTDQSDVARCWDQRFPKNRITPIFLRKTDIPPGSQKAVKIRPFEAADLIAYENFRALIAIEDLNRQIQFEELRKPMQRLYGLPGAKEWRSSDATSIENTCLLYKVPLRPVTPTS